MSSYIPDRCFRRGVSVVMLLVAAGAAQAAKAPAPARGDVGVDVRGLSATIQNPYAPFQRVKRAVFTGYDLDDDTKDTLKVRVVVTSRDSVVTMAGAPATMVVTVHYENGAVVERSWDYLAQDSAGTVHTLAHRVDDIEDGKVVDHVGQWQAGERRARAGIHMPAALAMGAEFEASRAPAISEARVKVTRTGFSITVPAGTGEDCVETEITDPVLKTSFSRIYCRDMGRVRDWSKSHALELVELELRTPPPQSQGR